MADEPKFTQADLDAALEKAMGPLTERLEAAEGKNAGLLDDLKKAQRELRSTQEIKPEQLQQAEERAEKAEATLAELNKQIKTLSTERDKAVKSLEAEQGAARSYALDAEINGATAAGNVIAGLVPGFTAMMMKGATVELVDGKYVAQIGGKPASEHIKEFLASDDGKAWRAAPGNGGGGAQGGSRDAPPAKTMKQSEFDALPPKERAAKMAEGYALASDEG